MYLEPKSYQFTFAFKLPLSTSVTDINCEEKLNQTEPIMLSADFPGIFRLQTDAEEKGLWSHPL